MTKQETIMGQVASNLATFAEEGIVTAPTDNALDELIAGYERDFGFMGSFEEWVDHHGEQYLVADFVFRYLETQGIALVHDSECIYIYQDDSDGYPALLDSYVDLASDRLDTLAYDINGDWSVQEDAQLTIRTDGQTFEEAMAYNGDYADVDSLLELLNRVVAGGTDATERYYRLRFSDGTGVSIGFVQPDHANTLREYFAATVDARR